MLVPISKAYGDEIVMPNKRRLMGDYTHHGVDIGGGQVIHYQSGTGSKANSVVRQVPMSRFHANPLEQAHYIAPPPGRSRHSVVARAKGLEGLGRYNLMLNNCEQFASGCRIGDVRPGQAALKAGGRWKAPLTAYLMANPITRRMVLRATKNATKGSRIWSRALQEARAAPRITAAEALARRA